MATILDATYLVDKLNINSPLIGVYDAPHNLNLDGAVVEPLRYRNTCIYAYFNAWMRGQTLKLTSVNFGCQGSGYWLFGKESRDREDFVDFLVDEEGLKCSCEVMGKWLDVIRPYSSVHKCLYIGPLRNSMSEYLKAVTFFVNPDQLSALIIGANYFNDGSCKNPIEVPFGTGCMQLLSAMSDSVSPRATIGATDIAMRKYLPKDILAFTINVAMFNELCDIDKGSYLDKPFFKDLFDFRKATK